MKVDPVLRFQLVAVSLAKIERVREARTSRAILHLAANLEIEPVLLQKFWPCLPFSLVE